jgi:hypothetical protein
LVPLGIFGDGAIQLTIQQGSSEKFIFRPSLQWQADTNKVSVSSKDAFFS